jgi:tyrosinase
VTLKAEPVEATLEPEGKAPHHGLTEQVKALRSGMKLHLVLLGLGTDAQPGVLYGVYLDLPPHATPEQKRMHSVGVLNFFNFIGHESEEAKNSADRRAVSLDVTEVAKRLQREGKLRDKPVITIAPIGKPKAAKPIVSEIHLTES